MKTAVVLFTRDLRVRDNPALAAAVRAAERVVPLFVLDEAIDPPANRQRFLVDCLADLRAALRERGADLVIRRGDPVAEAVRLAGETDAEGIVAARDVSRYARARQERLCAEAARHRISILLVDSVTVVPPGAVTPTGGDHFKVFTPYHRAWSAARWRDGEAAPERLTMPTGISVGRLPAHTEATATLPPGGETEARRRMTGWLRGGLADYEAGHDDLAGDRTSRLSAYLHFGCVSPLELATRAGRVDGGDPFVRQLCWRDFHAQVCAAVPDLARRDYRPRGHRWRDDRHALDAWRAGLTGYPVIDAGMRQLAAEGFMHNRARLLTASFLTKHLGIDWRAGAAHFFALLVDGDVANNSGNWQWVAGTGNDTRPNRVFNPLRQAHRFDPAGDYVRRYVPELASVTDGSVHEPWRLGGVRGYPAPIVDPDEPPHRPT